MPVGTINSILKKGRAEMKEHAAVFEKVPHNWTAYVPDLPGCATTGNTLEETRRSDVNGRFSFEGLEKGKYVLEGSPIPIAIKEIPEGTISNSLDGPPKYLATTTYYVNSSNRSSATDLSIQNGSSFAHVKFIMMEEKTNGRPKVHRSART